MFVPIMGLLFISFDGLLIYFTSLFFEVPGKIAWESVKEGAPLPKRPFISGGLLKRDFPANYIFWLGTPKSVFGCAPKRLP